MAVDRTNYQDNVSYYQDNINSVKVCIRHINQLKEECIDPVKINIYDHILGNLDIELLTWTESLAGEEE